MRPVVTLVAAIIAAGMLLLAPAKASIQAQIVCWDPDMEFPVACDDDGD